MENYFKIFKSLLTKNNEEDYITRLRKGEKIWRELDRELPKATGVEDDDKSRLIAFQRMVNTRLSAKDKARLISWIEHELYELECHFTEDTSASVEKLESKWKQIYRTHLEAIS